MKLHLSLFTLILLITTSITHADDYVWGEEFKEGDIISAATFNQIFNTLQKLNRTPVDADLVGTWSCDAVHSQSGLDTTGWTANDFILTLDNAQLTMTASSQSTSLAQSYSFSTSNPSPFIRFGTNTASSGTYILFNDMLLMKGVMSNSAVSKYQVNIVSDDRFILTPLSDGGNYPDLIMCDSAVAVPAAPTSTTAINAQTLVTVSWTDQSSDETGFKIYRRLSNETEAKEIATAVTSSPYSDSGLINGQTAYYSVAAYNDNGISKKSKVVSVTLDAQKPQVTSVSPANGSTTDIRIQPFNFYSASMTFSEVIIISEGFLECRNLTTDTICDYVIYSPSGFTNPGWGSTENIGPNNITNIGIYTDPGIGEIQLTIKNNFIRDQGGNNLAEDYIWSFTTQ